ncbi:hypothetical protein, partial [Chryseobacterium indoltheticum]|uniref:hypothetical protein n=1 Tax=Chryseobacterium indoltheticum TaxID=254 RepID=UPI003F492606
CAIRFGRKIWCFNPGRKTENRSFAFIVKRFAFFVRRFILLFFIKVSLLRSSHLYCLFFYKGQTLRAFLKYLHLISISR